MSGYFNVLGEASRNILPGEALLHFSAMRFQGLRNMDRSGRLKRLESPEPMSNL